jgi:hypothetical protein
MSLRQIAQALRPVDRLLAADKEFGRELFRIVPAPLVRWFGKFLDARRA